MGIDSGKGIDLVPSLLLLPSAVSLQQMTIGTVKKEQLTMRVGEQRLRTRRSLGFR